MLFEIKDFSFKYPTRRDLCLDNISLKINDGEFITVCGRSGCGKTTLLRNLKPALAPHGEISGTITFCGTALNSLTPRDQAEKIGFVLQNPESQIVTDKVWHEMAFGLENLGYDNYSMRLKIAEMASFFGISDWFYNDTSTLSGGQKQLLCLASIMVLSPSVLILDEPCAQLDPVAASDFIAILKKINSETGTAVIICEHRLEELFQISDRAVVMEKNKITYNGSPKNVGEYLYKSKSEMFLSLPSSTQIYCELGEEGNCPISVRDGRDYINSRLKGENYKTNYTELEKSEVVLLAKELFFKYEKSLPDVIKDLSFEGQRGKFTCILGGNGTGKSTFLSLLMGMYKPYRGKIKISGTIAMLTQNPLNAFSQNTLREDLCEVSKDYHDMAKKMDVEQLLDYNPLDLSVGEIQRAALCKILLTKPDILLLDEPTKGMDAFFKKNLSKILKQLLLNGITIIAVSHDVEFCAKYADMCALFFAGSIIASAETHDFFAMNNFYTTASNRIVRHKCKNALTVQEVTDLCRENN